MFCLILPTVSVRQPAQRFTMLLMVSVAIGMLRMLNTLERTSCSWVRLMLTASTVLMRQIMLAGFHHTAPLLLCQMENSPLHISPCGMQTAYAL